MMMCACVCLHLLNVSLSLCIDERDVVSIFQLTSLQSDIVVKVLDKKVGSGEYYKKKGVVVRVKDDFLADVEMNDSGDMIRVDQEARVLAHSLV
jgi:hypothetical protein